MQDRIIRLKSGHAQATANPLYPPIIEKAGPGATVSGRIE